MTTGGERLRVFIERRWLELSPDNRRHGMQAAIQRATQIKRQTMGKWWTGKAEPDMRRLAMLADLLQVSRADLVAVLDGTDSRRKIPAILSDAERRRRRKWWLGIARLTAGLGLGEARDAMAARGFRSERGNLVSLWEDPRSRLEPTDVQLRSLAEVYRLPIEQLADVWNNPPATDEEEMAGRRGVRIEPVREGEPVELPGDVRRRTA